MLLAVRSSRIVERSVCRPRILALALSLSPAARLESDRKRQSMIPQIMHFSSFAHGLAGTSVEDLVLPIRRFSLADDQMNKAAHRDASGESPTVVTFLGNEVRNQGSEQDGKGMIDWNSDDFDHDYDGQDVAKIQKPVNRSSTNSIRPVKVQTCVEDSTNEADARSISHIAHLLGIVEHETLTVLETLSGSPDELLSNLSFLMSVGFQEKELMNTVFMHPSLMAVDLDKSLSRVIKCLQKVKLDASFLKQILTVQPSLVPLLEKGALKERLKALRKLEFPLEDLGTLLKRIGSILLKQFLSLPVEKIESTYTYITDDIGLRNCEAIKLITAFPSVLLRDIDQDYALKLNVLKEVFGELNKAKKLFKQLPELLARKVDAFEETVLYLKDMVKDVNKLNQIIEANPSILTHRKSGIDQVSLFLQSLGFGSEKSIELIAWEPYLVECGSDRLKKHVGFLETKGFDKSSVCRLMESSTGIFFKSLGKRVAPNIHFLENQGITGESLQNYMKSRPQVCDRSLKKSLNPNLDFLLSLGFEKNSPSLKSALKVILPLGHKSLQHRINYIIGLGIDNTDVHKMVREEPSILATPDASLKKRVDFLLTIMRRPVQELVKCPSFLISSISRVIMPRLKVLEWLCSKGFLKKFSLCTLVETDEALFMKKYVQVHPEAMSIYTGSSQISS